MQAPLQRLIYLLLLSLMAASADAVPAQSGTERYTNRLINSNDPYLLLHAHNPVDWYPWGPEALDKARRENKPIFISIGYSTCYWCHVAEREIYSDPQIAGLMNQWFVNIKIDREERPDLDQIYMLVTQIMTGHGGWPNNVFLTPDLKPFFAGSYFPPQDLDGRPGFPKILAYLHQAWTDDHDRVVALAERVYQRLVQAEKRSANFAAALPDTRMWLAQAVRESTANFDEIEGGFKGGSTKFPQAPTLSMLLVASNQGSNTEPLELVTRTLEAMAQGGVMDQLDAGFHRYSTEPGWSVPHFEKMLYDNAQLLGLYAQAFAITKSPLMRQVALRTAHYLSTRMQAPGGAFYSAQDAEVDGVEGASYAWTRVEIDAVLGVADARRFFELYSLTPLPEAHFGHQQPAGGVLRLKRNEARKLAEDRQLAKALSALAPLRKKLLVVRQKRDQPARDEKIVIADNALAIIAFAQAGQALHESALSATAERTANWLWQHAFDPESGALRHQFYQGHAGNQGFLDDYALLSQAFLTLFHSTGNSHWRSYATQVADAMLQRFARTDGALTMSWDSMNLLVTLPAQGDSSKPSGASAAIAVLLDLAASTHEPRYAHAAYKALRPLAATVAARPSGWGALMAALNEPRLLAVLDGAVRADAPEFTGKPLSSGQFVHASGTWERSKHGADISVTIDIDEGYHINANPPSDAYLVATQLMLDGYPEVIAEYPQSQSFKAAFAPQGIDVYQGRITLNARLPQHAELPLPAVHLRVQACNHEACLAPAIIEVQVTGSQ